MSDLPRRKPIERPYRVRWQEHLLDIWHDRHLDVKSLHTAGLVASHYGCKPLRRFRAVRILVTTEGLTWKPLDSGVPS